MFVGNDKTMLIHTEDCEYAQKIEATSRVEFEELYHGLGAGYNEARCCLTEHPFLEAATKRSIRELAEEVLARNYREDFHKERALQEKIAITRDGHPVLFLQRDGPGPALLGYMVSTKPPYRMGQKVELAPQSWDAAGRDGEYLHLDLVNSDRKFELRRKKVHLYGVVISGFLHWTERSDAVSSLTTEGPMKTELFLKGEQYAVRTEAKDEDSFSDEFAQIVHDMVEAGTYKGELYLHLTKWLPEYAEICMKYRGYKTNVVESRVLISGFIAPTEESKVVPFPMEKQQA